MRFALMSAMVLALASAGAAARQDATQPAAGAPADAQASARERLLKAIRLPRRAQEIRDLGMSASDVREAMKAAKEKKIPAAEMADVVDDQADAVRQHGPVDNFGAFVKARLAEGLRGRDLAAAIRAEHAKRGKGKGAAKKLSNDPAPRGGATGDVRPDDRAKGKPDADRSKGKPDDRGKPDDDRKPKGKPDGDPAPEKGKGKGPGKP